jgi:hypothetical protein
MMYSGVSHCILLVQTEHAYKVHTEASRLCLFWNSHFTNVDGTPYVHHQSYVFLEGLLILITESKLRC